ncbi:MAG: acyl-CoA dehydrogenase, partial [Deltaproteobacteria bacterium]
MTRDSVRAFVERECLPVIEQCHSRDEFPRHLIPRMAELGIFGANLRGYGCAGMNNVAYGLIMQELERADSGLRSMASVQGGLSMYAIYA